MSQPEDSITAQQEAPRVLNVIRVTRSQQNLDKAPPIQRPNVVARSIGEGDPWLDVLLPSFPPSQTRQEKEKEKEKASCACPPV